MMAWVLCVSSLHAGVVDPGVGKAGSSSRSETGTGSGVSVVDVGSGPTMSDTEDLDPPADLLGPRDVSEESLPDFAGAGVGFYPPLELAKRVAEHGATHLNPHSTPHLTLFLADWALNAGAALRNPEWLRIKAGALMVLERYSEALGVMENLPPFLFREDPLLTLQLARVHLANGGYKPARELYSRFLVEQSQNFQVKEAEKGMVLTVLAAGELDQAELLLGLMTEAGDKRLRNDPDLAAAMGRLMHLKGRKAESGR
ncbi:MAG TPA: tetratricopeptide repeat protein, partial [Magnetococcales bacterium]|nr:tetratricopeptide repeat protein [Magnetococcales bacterium]